MNLSPFIQRKKNLVIYLVYITVFGCSLQNYQYTFENSTSIDLLYRVIGSRLMVDGKSPYYDKWQPGKPDAARYYHPIPRYSQKINGVTVTPAILWMNSAFSEIEFCKAREIWFYIQIGILFLCGLLMLISFRQFWQKLIALVAFIAFFVFSRNFYLHLHSAQVYIFYGLIFCCLYLLLKSKLSNRYFYIGLLITLGIWLKPFFIVLFFPFLFRKNWQVLKGALLMGSILLVHTLAFDHWKLWKEYVSAMPEYALDVPLSHKKKFLKIERPNFEVASCVYPMRNPRNLPLNAASLKSVQYYLLKMGITVTNAAFFAVSGMLVALILSIMSRKRKFTADQLLAFLFLLYLAVELFTPAFRFGYYLVQWAAVSVIVLINYRKHKIASLLMLIGLMINNGYMPFPDVYEGLVGEALMIIAVAWFILSDTGKTNLNKMNKVQNVQVSDTTEAK